MLSTANVVTLTWSSQSAKTYRVEYKDDLNSTIWNVLGDFNVDSNAASATDKISATPQRFYRIYLTN